MGGPQGSAGVARGGGHDRQRLAARLRPLDPLAGDARPRARAGGRHRCRAVEDRDRGLGRPAAGAPGAGRPVGRQRLLAGPDRHVPRPGAAAAAGARSREPAGNASDRPRPRACHLGGRRLVEPTLGRQGVLRGRGRTVHQRQRRRDRLVLRPGHGAAGRPAPRRAAPRRRLELRGRERRDGVLDGDDDQRPRGPARARAGDRGLGQGRGGPPPGRGVPARAPAVPPEDDRRGDPPRLAPVLLPALVSLRHPPGSGLPARCRRRARRARLRSDRGR